MLKSLKLVAHEDEAVDELLGVFKIVVNIIVAVEDEEFPPTLNPAAVVVEEEALEEDDEDPVCAPMMSTPSLPPPPPPPPTTPLMTSFCTKACCWYLVLMNSDFVVCKLSRGFGFRGHGDRSLPLRCNEEGEDVEEEEEA